MSVTFPGDIATAIDDLQSWQSLVQGYAPALSDKWGFLYKNALLIQQGKSAAVTLAQVQQGVVDFGNVLVQQVPWYALVGYEIGNDVSHGGGAAGHAVSAAAKAALGNDFVREMETVALWIGGGIVALMALPYLLEMTFRRRR